MWRDPSDRDTLQQLQNVRTAADHTRRPLIDPLEPCALRYVMISRSGSTRQTDRKVADAEWFKWRLTDDSSYQKMPDIGPDFLTKNLSHSQMHWSFSAGLLFAQSDADHPVFDGWRFSRCHPTEKTDSAELDGSTEERRRKIKRSDPLERND